MQAPAILTTHVGLFVGLAVYESIKVDSNGVAPFRAATLIIGYLIGLYTSLIIYRVFFHRLRHFPGPRLAGITKLWHVYNTLDARNHELLHGIHKQYGDFVRIGPNEIAAFHPDAHHVLEGPGSDCSKSDIFDLMEPDHSLVLTRRTKEHHSRRALWTRMLSPKAIAEYKPQMLMEVDRITGRFADAARNKETMTINDNLYWFTYDVMGRCGFDKEFNQVQDQAWHPAVDMMRRATSIFGPFQPAIWIVRIGFAFFWWAGKVADWFGMLAYCEQEVNRKAALKSKGGNLFIGSAFYDALQTEADRQEAVRWLRGDAATLMVAGSETSAPALIFTFYALAQHPESTEKAFEELRDADVTDLSVLSVLPHFNALISEAMRLYSSAPTFVSRDTPVGGVNIGGRHIPGKVKVSAPRWTISKMESAFERGTEFVPERWYSKPEMIRNRNAFAPFGMGRMSCVGREFAMSEIRMLVAAVIRKFYIELADEDAKVSVVRDMRDKILANPGPLRVKFTERTAAS
ncbi:MAG: hypothetical protein Q9162_001050 [Coniocarpon cinnabarinum]